MNREEFHQKRVALLLSGGVDSAVALHELVGNDIRPDCFYIKIGSEDNDEWDCSMEEDMEMATALCHRYGVTLEVVDCHRDYWDEVTRYTIESVRAGRTPNPDVMCNRMIKFGAFDRKRGHDYDLIATGHYAQTEIDENGVKWLTTSPDPVKDQTDFLAQIYDWQLRKALFPIGHYRKEEIRAIAEREHLVNARRKDSQGICFLGKISYNDYLRRYLGEQKAIGSTPSDSARGSDSAVDRGMWFGRMSSEIFSTSSRATSRFGRIEWNSTSRIFISWFRGILTILLFQNKLPNSCNSRKKSPSRSATRPTTSSARSTTSATAATPSTPTAGCRALRPDSSASFTTAISTVASVQAKLQYRLQLFRELIRLTNTN